MLIVISPSKTLDFDCRSYPEKTLPFFLPQIRELAGHLKTLSKEDLAQLMKISPRLAALNHDRYRNFLFPFTPDNSRQALLAFKGDVYQNMAVDGYRDTEFDFAQGHLRILSGLYGLLRPLDLIQPYRLEMGTRLAGPWGKDLYQFWNNRITDRLSREIKESTGSPVLVNLASSEYFKAVRPQRLSAPVLHIHFMEKKGGTLKVIGIHAKRARGLMTDFIVRNQIHDPEELRSFDLNGYRLSLERSTETDWIFARG